MSLSHQAEFPPRFDLKPITNSLPNESDSLQLVDYQQIECVLAESLYVNRGILADLHMRWY